MKYLSIILIIGLVVAGLFLLDGNDGQTSTSSSKEDAALSQETIDLDSKQLTQVPTDILNDTDRTMLDVSNNQLTGALPAEIRNLQNLEVLNASYNQLTGIPAEIGQLQKLREIDFSHNDISGLPLELGNLKQLETLDLRNNPNLSSYDLGLIAEELTNTNILTD